MTRLVVDLINADGNEVTVELPALWEICSACNGEGRSSAYLGAITSDEWHRDWSEDERADYMQGGLDRQCDCCSGRGSVLVVDVASCRAPAQLANLKAWQDQQRENAECDAIQRAEIARGA